MNRDKIIIRVRNKLKRAQTTTVTDQEVTIPDIPKSLLRPETKREINYFKHIKELYNLLGKDTLTGLNLKTKDNQGVFIFIDGDGLKKINDTHGHASGTAAIKALTQGIKKALRGKDKAETSRMGGDEFIVRLEAMSTATGVKIAKRILESIRDQNISDFYIGDKKIKDKLSKIPLRASLGVGKTKEEADKAMYKAKEKGRDRVEFFSNKDS